MARLKLEGRTLASTPLFAPNPLKRQKIHFLKENEHLKSERLSLADQKL